MNQVLITLIIFLCCYSIILVKCATSDDCELPSETGPCRAMIRLFYYNSASKECEQFIYGGCRGNNNRFHSKQECIETCGHGSQHNA